MEQPIRIRYAGSPLFASSLCRALEIVGVAVRFDDVEPSDSDDGSADGWCSVTVHFLCSGSRAAIHVAVQHFLDNCSEPGTTVEVLGER